MSEPKEDPRTSSFHITDPDTIAALDGLTPEQLDNLSKFMEEGLQRLREKYGVRKP